MDITHLLKGIRDPRRAATFMHRRMRGEFYYRLRSLNQRYYRRHDPPDGYDLLSEEWDTAIILDACRYDTFAEVDWFDTEIYHKTAVGSESREFFMRTFGSDTYHDIVYVTGNPYITALDSNTFHNVHLDEAWNTAGTAASPRRLTDAALRAHEEYPNKRIIVHYMQPHLPIIAPKWQDINEYIHYDGKGEYFPVKGLSAETLYSAYKANLKYVLQYVDELLDGITGTTLITADHGELMGDRQRPIPVRGFNHHESLYTKELTQVPWVVLHKGSSRHTFADPPAGEIDVDEQDRREQLRSLGYLE